MIKLAYVTIIFVCFNIHATNLTDRILNDSLSSGIHQLTQNYDQLLLLEKACENQLNAQTLPSSCYKLKSLLDDNMSSHLFPFNYSKVELACLQAANLIHTIPTTDVISSIASKECRDNLLKKIELLEYSKSSIYN